MVNQLRCQFYYFISNFIIDFHPRNRYQFHCQFYYFILPSPPDFYPHTGINFMINFTASFYIHNLTCLCKIDNSLIFIIISKKLLLSRSFLFSTFSRCFYQGLQSRFLQEVSELPSRSSHSRYPEEELKT